MNQAETVSRAGTESDDETVLLQQSSSATQSAEEMITTVWVGNVRAEREELLPLFSAYGVCGFHPFFCLTSP